MLSVVDRSVAKDVDDLGPNDALGLCDRIETPLLAGGSASVVLYRTPPKPDAVRLDDYPAGTAGSGKTLEDLDTSLTSSDLVFLEELVGGLR